MPTMEEIEEGYFNYLVNEMLDALLNADRYNCKDFEIVKLDLMLKVHKIFDTKQGLEEKVKVLSLWERNKK